MVSPVLELKDINKSFGHVHANKNINLNNILYNSKIYHLWLKSNQTETILHNINDPWLGEAGLADAIFQGRYNFAGEEINSPYIPLWEPSGVGPWGIAEMHGFSWV